MGSYGSTTYTSSSAPLLFSVESSDSPTTTTLIGHKGTFNSAFVFHTLLQYVWIVDTSASDHMTDYVFMFTFLHFILLI